jgi:hypothetical protein
MDPKQFDIALHDAEVKLKRLKALYEQWFQGVERIEPQVPRKDLERLFQTLNKEKPRNTAARFRLQQLQARFNVYASYWQRIARQIEEGTYERDLRRARRRRGAGTAEPKEVKTFEMDLDEAVDVDMDALEDEIADVLSVLDGKGPSEPKPAAPPQRPLSAFSPFAMGRGAKAPARAAEPKAPRAPQPSTSSPQRASDDTRPNAPNPFHGARPPAAPKEGNPFKKEPVTATFGKPKASPPRRPAPPGPRAAPPGRKPPPPPPPQRAAGAGRPPPPPPRRGDDPHLRRLYDAYVAARRRNNERVDNLRYDKMANSVQKMRSKLRKKHGDKKIDFEVVVQNGRVGLKPKID